MCQYNAQMPAGDTDVDFTYRYMVHYVNTSNELNIPVPYMVKGCVFSADLKVL